MPPGQESRELQLIAQWKKKGILVPVTNVPTDLILITCGDPDAEIPTHYRNLARHLSPQSRIRHHLLTQNGAYLEAPEIAIQHALQGVNLKTIHQIAICGHGPCAMANHLGLELEDQIKAQKQAIAAIKGRANGQAASLQIHSHFHFSWAGKVELLEFKD